MPPTFTFFAGKGGVGKTTCAAAHAVSSATAGVHTLVLSTDPAHSLGDVLGTTLSGRPRAIRFPRGARRTGGTLAAAEIDAPRAFSRWLALHRQPLGDILEQGTWLDRADVDAMMGLSIPGVDELVGLVEIVRLASAPYDRVVVDTAPTGHTLRLLDAPEAVAAVAHVLDALYDEHRVIRDQLARIGRPEAADRLIALLARQAAESAAMLRDMRRVRVCWLTLPEALSLAEAEDGVHALASRGMFVETIVVNAVTPDGPQCAVCDRSRVAEHAVIRRAARSLGRDRSLVIVPACPSEPRGVEALAVLGRALDRPQPSKRPAAPRRRARPTGLAISAARPSPGAAAALRPFRDLELIFVGGKGGVGKTTVAATLALTLARNDRRKTLLLSTDPAHSLGDVFGESIGDRFTRVSGSAPSLRVREIDAASALRSRRDRLEAAVEEILSAAGASAGRITLRNSAADIMELAPPGMDELLGLLSIVEAREQFSRVIVDAAPTGHALRLLEMPEAALEWVRLLLRMLVKYRSLVRPGSLGAELVALSRAIRALQAQLRDPHRTGFVVVTRAAEIPRVEADRFAARLARYRMPVSAMIVNALTLAPGRCPTCNARHLAERRTLARIDGGVVPCVIIHTPRTAPPVRGVRRLERWARSWTIVNRP